jgi:hypothetical protein
VETYIRPNINLARKENRICTEPVSHKKLSNTVDNGFTANRLGAKDSQHNIKGFYNPRKSETE